MPFLPSPLSDARADVLSSDPDPAPSFGAAIRSRRVARGWSQEQLARAVAARGDEAISQADISRLELGKVGLPRSARLQRLAAALDLSLVQLLALAGWGGSEAACATLDSPILTLQPAVAGVPGAAEIDMQTFILDRLMPWTIENPAESAGAMALEEARDRLHVATARAREVCAESQLILARSAAQRQGWG